MRMTDVTGCIWLAVGSTFTWSASVYTAVTACQSIRTWILRGVIPTRRYDVNNARFIQSRVEISVYLMRNSTSASQKSFAARHLAMDRSNFLICD